jgi:hypothetical protein
MVALNNPAPDFSEAQTRSETKLSNKTDRLCKVFVEPWGTTLYLLPGTDYVIKSESEPHEAPPTATIELGENATTVWPGGTKRNRIERAEGDVIWSDSDTGQLAPYLDDRVVAFARPQSEAGIGLRELGQLLQTEFADRHWARADVPFLLVERGLLRLDPGRKPRVSASAAKQSGSRGAKSRRERA